MFTRRFLRASSRRSPRQAERQVVSFYEFDHLRIFPVRRCPFWHWRTVSPCLQKSLQRGSRYSPCSASGRGISCTYIDGSEGSGADPSLDSVSGNKQDVRHFLDGNPALGYRRGIFRQGKRSGIGRPIAHHASLRRPVVPPSVFVFVCSKLAILSAMAVMSFGFIHICCIRSFGRRSSRSRGVGGGCIRDRVLRR